MFHNIIKFMPLKPLRREENLNLIELSDGTVILFELLYSRIWSSLIVEEICIIDFMFLFITMKLL